PALRAQPRGHRVPRARDGRAAHRPLRGRDARLRALGAPQPPRGPRGVQGREGVRRRRAYDGGMSAESETDPLVLTIKQALRAVMDPEIHRPITDLHMVRSIDLVENGGQVTAVVGVDLTTAGCPLQDTITRDVEKAVGKVAGVDRVRVDLGVMSAEQRKDLRTMLRGTDAEPVIPFAQPGSLTKVFAIASG